MLSPKAIRVKWRALLTETLPYEVPVIFSNDLLYASAVANIKNVQLRNAYDQLLATRPSLTVPYSYNIIKERGQTTTLGVIHPLCQLTIAEFYETYSQSLIDYCKKSEFSLRRPIAPTALFSKEELAGDTTFKLGIPHADPDEGELDVSHITSYFAYGRYNLLHKFFDSKEYLGLEMRYSKLRTLDVSKCFFNIYTHSITWAVKSKVFSKDNRNAYSFEGQFDSLMQCANYRETNGIVVGPEVSRIFAEIIFQDIDRKILRGLSKLRIGRDFAIRRYVDDYFIFANLEQHLDEIEMTVRRELERYKLFLNEKKISTSGRPFVSQITLARRDIRGIISEISRSFEGLEGCDDVRILRRQARLVQDKMLEVRLVVANYQVGFHTISGWLLTSLRGVLKSVGTVLWSAESQEQFDSIVEIIMGILRVIFYLVAMDLRVRTTYGVCQVISVVNSLTSKLDADRKDQLSHLIAEQLELLIGGLLSSDALGGEQADSVELYNLLICGAHNFGSTFLRRDAVGVALRTILDKPRFTYFGYITAKFCFLRDRAAFSEELAQLNTLMQSYVDRSFSKWDVDSETYLILCDYFSAPDISESDKCKLFNAVFHAAVSKRTMALLGKLVAYADWDGLRIEHLLARKELQPVYAWD